MRGRELYTDATAPELLEAVTVNEPASRTDTLMVTIPAYGDTMPAFGPVIWQPHGTHLPPAGTACLVAKVAARVWVLAWDGGWT